MTFLHVALHVDIADANLLIYKEKKLFYLPNPPCSTITELPSNAMKLWMSCFGSALSILTITIQK